MKTKDFLKFFTFNFYSLILTSLFFFHPLTLPHPTACYAEEGGGESNGGDDKNLTEEAKKELKEEGNENPTDQEVKEKLTEMAERMAADQMTQGIENLNNLSDEGVLGESGQFPGESEEAQVPDNGESDPFAQPSPERIAEIERQIEEAANSGRQPQPAKPEPTVTASGVIGNNNCGQGVINAIEQETGVNIASNAQPGQIVNGHPTVDGMGQMLQQNGYSPVSSQGYTPQPGDVQCINFGGQGIGGYGGHTQYYNGQEWISDHRQGMSYANSGFLRANGIDPSRVTVTTYRR